MKVIVHGVHLSLNEEMKAYVDKRLRQALEHFADDEAAELEVMLKDINGPKGGADKECSVTFRMPGSAGIHVSETSDDIYKSIDLAEDRLVKAAKREMQKKREISGHHVSKPAARLGMELSNLPEQ